MTLSGSFTPWVLLLIEKFEHWTRRNLAQGFSLQQAAKARAISTGTLQLRSKAALAKSLFACFQDRRVEHARRLVETTAMDLGSIAAEVGYADDAMLRSLLRRRPRGRARELRSG